MLTLYFPYTISSIQTISEKIFYLSHIDAGTFVRPTFVQLTFVRLSDHDICPTPRPPDPWPFLVFRRKKDRLDKWRVGQMVGRTNDAIYV